MKGSYNVEANTPKLLKLAFTSKYWRFIWEENSSRWSS